MRKNHAENFIKSVITVRTNQSIQITRERGSMMGLERERGSEWLEKNSNWSDVMREIKNRYAGFMGECEPRINKDDEFIRINGIRVMPTPVHYDVITDIYDKPVAIEVEFSDGSKTKAVCSADDKFEYETGYLICLMKRTLSMYSGGKYSTKLYNKFIRLADKALTEQARAEKAEKDRQDEIARRRAKKAEKRAKRKAAQLRKQREERVSVMTEAFTNALFNLARKQQEREKKKGAKNEH